MARNFSSQVSIDGRTILAVILPQLRQDGMYYEVNIKGYPRFFMTWTELGRYDLAGVERPGIPYEVILAVSDAIEREVKRS